MNNDRELTKILKPMQVVFLYKTLAAKETVLKIRQ